LAPVPPGGVQIHSSLRRKTFRGETPGTPGKPGRQEGRATGISVAASHARRAAAPGQGGGQPATRPTAARWGPSDSYSEGPHSHLPTASRPASVPRLSRRLGSPPQRSHDGGAPLVTSC